MQFYTNIAVWGNSILCRGYDNNGPFQYKQEFKPTLYVNTQNKNSKYKLLNGTPVEEIQPGSIKDSKEFFERYKDVEGFNVYGQTSYGFQYISENFSGEIQYDSSKIRVHFMDIESETEHGFPNLSTANEVVNAITVYDTVAKESVTFGFGEFDISKGNYIKCNSESDMLSKYIIWHSSNYPDVITGWFSNGFDIPYLCRRIEKILGIHSLNKLSPWSNVSNNERMYAGEMEYTSSILGISLIDYLDLYKKFVLSPRENYKLDTIAEIELGKKKVDHSEYASFKDFYTQNFQKFIEYNIEDTSLVHELECKLKLLEVLFTIAYIAKVNYDDVFSPVKTWDAIIYNYLRDKDVVIPEQKYSSREDYPGGYVKEPIKGMYEWIASFDLQSSYPHQIMQYAISPENFTGERIDLSLEDLVSKKKNLEILKEKNLTMTANGWLYKRENAMFPDLVRSMYNLRSDAKKEMKKWKTELEEDKGNETIKNKISEKDNLQMAMKILLNSLYGAVGSPYFRYYDKRIAEGITLSGQLAVMWMLRKFNEYFNKAFKTTDVDYCIYSDTDSVYLNLEPLITQFGGNKSVEGKIDFMDKFCKDVLSPFIEKCFVEMAEYMNAYEQKMVMGRDTLSSKGIFCSKKKYILNEYDSEGVRYKEPKKKIIGLQMIQSSTPKVIKEKLRESLDLIINGAEEELQDYVLKLEHEFRKFQAEEISKPTGVDGVTKYSDTKTIYIKGTPIHVRGSLLFNKLVKDLKLDDKYQPIKDNDKIKYTYLKTPNPLREDVIAFPSELPEEFDLHKYVDFELQFQKVYLSPLNTILDAIGWTSHKSNSMDDLFG